MFTISFENEVYKQWTCEFVFENFNDAKSYLINKGFIEKNRLFERRDHNWNKYSKAYINRAKVYRT